MIWDPPHRPLRLSWLRRLGALLLAGLAASLARPQTIQTAPAAPAHPPLKCHQWSVSYQDSLLGLVDGVAEVDWTNQEAQVKITHPLTGVQATLTAVTVTPPANNGQAEFVLQGGFASLDQLSWPNVQGLPNTNTSNPGASTKISGSFGLTRAQQANRTFADDVVTVTMTPDDDGDLTGQWHYAADPVTERLRDGTGRVGAFTMSPDSAGSAFAGVQTAREEWTQLRPEIADVRVLDTGATTYPAAPTPTERGAGGAPRFDLNHRTLFVIGRHFPLWKESGKKARKLEDIATQRTDLTYYFDGASDDPAPAAAPTGAAAGAPDPFEEGWKLVTAGRSYAETQKIRSLEAVLIDVRFANGVIPGVTDFDWGGAKGTWRLVFSDVNAALRVVRRLPNDVSQPVKGPRTRIPQSTVMEQWEGTPSVFLPEQVAIEVQTSVPLALDSIDVFAAPQGKFNSTPLTATRVAGAAPGLYRTGPISVYHSDQPVPAGGGLAVPAREGDALIFVGEQKKGCFANAGVAAAVTYDDPSELSVTWHHALSLCAQIDGRPSVDWAHLPGSQVEAFTRTFIYAWVVDAAKVATGIPLTPQAAASEGRTGVCNLSLGQHAAMLMLRDTFIEMMTLQKGNLENLVANVADPDLQEKKDDALLGFGNAIVDAVRRQPSLIYATLSGGFVGGQNCTLPEALDDTRLDQAFDGDPVKIRSSKLGTLRQALGAYVEEIQKSIDQAKSIPNDEREKLLDLTGRSFGGVVARLLPRLMKVDPNSQQWVPDTLARGYVQSIADKAAELAQLGAASKIDTQLAVGVLTAAVAAPVMLSESAFASFLVWGANGLIWGVQSAHEVYDAAQVKTEVAFAHGSATVLGSLRYEEAKLEDTDWWKTAASIVGQGVLANLQGLDALSKFGREMSVFRGAQVMEETAGLKALRLLPKESMSDVQAFIIEAKAAETAGLPLSEVQRSALATWDQLAEQAKANSDAISTAWQNGQDLNKLLRIQADPLTPLVEEQQSLLQGLPDMAKAETAAKQEFGPFEIPGKEKFIGDAIKTAKARVDVIQAMVDLSIRYPVDFARVSPAEVLWLTGTQAEIDTGRMQGILRSNDSIWKTIVDKFETRQLSPSDMHQFITWRKQVVDKMLDEVIAQVQAEVSAELGRPVKIGRQAFGSTNLTSDYDISVGGPGAERVVGRFNAAFREAFGGLESGTVFDTNVYTDPVYKLFGVRELAGQGLELGAAEMDAVRQFIYDQTATRKYAPDPIWAKHKKILLEAAAPDRRAMVQFALEQAEVTDAEARSLLKARRADLAEAGANASGGNVDLRAGNDAYSDVLLQIDGWRTEYARLDGLSTGGSSLSAPQTDFLKDYPNYQDKVNRYQQLIQAGKTGEAKTMLEGMRREVIAQMRDRQGLALYFASEAYEAEGTIAHVVDELQGPNKRPVTFDSLKSKPPQVKRDSLSYINSFNENRGNMIKEFGHLGVYGGGHPVAGEKLAAKSAKYFIRQLDAARQAGIDIGQALGTDILDLTVKIDANRGTLSKVVAILDEAKTTGPGYVQTITDASDKLAALCVQNQQFSDLSKFLELQFADLRELGIEARVEPSVNVPRSSH